MPHVLYRISVVTGCFQQTVEINQCDSIVHRYKYINIFMKVVVSCEKTGVGVTGFPIQEGLLYMQDFSCGSLPPQ